MGLIFEAFLARYKLDTIPTNKATPIEIITVVIFTIGLTGIPAPPKFEEAGQKIFAPIIPIIKPKTPPKIDIKIPSVKK